MKDQSLYCAPLVADPVWTCEPFCPQRRSAPWVSGRKTDAPDVGSTRITMREGELWSVEGHGTFPVHCAGGTLWVTSPGAAGDIVLSSGERLEVPTREKALVSAMCLSAIWLPPGFVVDAACHSSSRRVVVRRAR